MKIYIMNKIVEKGIEEMRNLYFGEKTYEELDKVKSNIKDIYDKYKDDKESEEVAIEYFRFIFDLLFGKFKLTISKEIEEEAKRIYYNNPSEKVAEKYIEFLVLLSTQKRKSASNTAIVESDKVYEMYPNSKVIKQNYFIVLQMLFKNSKVEVVKLYERIVSILEVYPQRVDKIDKLIDRLMTNSNNKEKHSEKICELINLLSSNNEIKKSLIRSKYSFLYDENNKLTKDELIQIIEIWCLVQKIKEQLIVKKPAKLKFGHYTSGAVLQIFLAQKKKEDKENKENKESNETEENKYSIVTRSRLNNVNYMNDPSEGKVLNQFLNPDEISQQSSLKPSPWFLMSLTTAIDQLTMWSQYGDQAEGVCLVLDSGDFSTVGIFSEIDTLKSSFYKEEITSELKENSIILESGLKDYIYHVGYLDNHGDYLLKPEYNKCLEGNGGNEINIINKSLVDLKSRIEKIDKVNEPALYEKVDECLEEIRYLFKSADYSYESELRVLKYMPLEPDNSKIKIDDKGKYAKLYIERDNPIQISEVIFGPKFQNPENVTPLLYLLDKNIKFRQSDISFR